MNTETPSRDGGPIAVVDRSREETNAIFRRLRKLMADCGPEADKHDLAVTLISGCIIEGLDEGRRIVGALAKLGFNRQHVGMTLKEGTGNSPTRHRWWRDAEGKYALHLSSADAVSL